MPRRHITRRSLGAAAGGLLGVAFLPAAAAFADEGYDYGNYDLVPNSPDVLTDGGIRNFLVEVPPGAAGSVQGTQELVVDSPSGTPVGTIEVDVTNTTDEFDNTNQEILVTADLTGTPGSAAGDVPPVGSVFDTESYTSGIQAVYANIAGAGAKGADLISYSWDSAFGDSAIPTSYDAITTVVPVDVKGAGAGFTDDKFVLAGPETIEGVNGIAPADYDLLGTQTFDVDNSSGDQVGSFTAEVANSSDILGNTTQDMLVTSSTGDAPAVGAVYDYFFTGTAGNDSIYNVYADIPSTSGGAGTVTDHVVSPFGSSALLIDFDAANGLANVLDGKSPLATGMSTKAFDITPDTSTSPNADATIVAVDGIQPEDIDVQGTQEFNWDPGTDQAGVFDADVTQSTIIFGNTTQEQLVVTQDVSGDAPQVGSVFEVYNYGDGFEQVYSDIVTSNGDEITDTTVTPFGDVSVPYDYDASAALANNSSEKFAEAGLAAATLDPSAAVDSSSLAELFPQLDAALNLLTGLF